MTIKVLVTLNNRKQYDISELVSPPKWVTSIESQPGTLTFDMLDNKDVYVSAGDIVEMIVSGKKIFKGWVFNRRKTKQKKWSIIAYDVSRYLKNEDTLVFNASTASSRFKTICNTQGIKFKVLDNSTYRCTAVVENKHTYYSMLEDAINETRENQGTRYAFWDNYGTLEFFNLNRGITKLVIGDESLMTDYDFEGSIDDAANSVKVLREDRESGSREIYSAKDDKNIQKWGKLQVVEMVSDADLNSSQLKNQAKVLLSERNKETKIMTVTARGDLSLRAGNSFILRISDLSRENFAQDSLALIKHCTHDFEDGHTMSLEVEVVA